jgi:hypothetical protein
MVILEEFRVIHIKSTKETEKGEEKKHKTKPQDVNM